MSSRVPAQQGEDAAQAASTLPVFTAPVTRGTHSQGECALPCAPSVLPVPAPPALHGAGWWRSPPPPARPSPPLTHATAQLRPKTRPPQAALAAAVVAPPAPFIPPTLVKPEDRVMPRLGEGYQAVIPPWPSAAGGGQRPVGPRYVQPAVQLHSARGSLQPLQAAFLEKVSLFCQGRPQGGGSSARGRERGGGAAPAPEPHKCAPLPCAVPPPSPPASARALRARTPAPRPPTSCRQRPLTHSCHHASPYTATHTTHSHLRPPSDGRVSGAAPAPPTGCTPGRHPHPHHHSCPQRCSSRHHHCRHCHCQWRWRWRSSSSSSSSPPAHHHHHRLRRHCLPPQQAPGSQGHGHRGPAGCAVGLLRPASCLRGCPGQRHTGCWGWQR